MKNIKSFKCMICGKDFTELSPIHEVKCICIDCYKKAVDETYGKQKEIVTMKKLKKIING